jgi:poly(hydroxyalkanoate) depolymerase family esterase
MLQSLRRWLAIALAKVRRAPLRPRALLTYGKRRDADVGRWIAQRFVDTRDVSFGERARRRALNYSVYLPAGGSRRDALPLLVMLHGCQQDAALFAAGTRMQQLADRERCIVLYPEQLREANPYGCWNWFDSATIDGGGEAGMIAELTRTVIARYPVDSTRVYLAGMSAGGVMACTLVIHHGHLFAAAAIHSGLMHAAATSALQAASAMQAGSRTSPAEALRQALKLRVGKSALVPTLVIHGRDDQVVNPVNGEQIVEQLRLLAETTAAAPLAPASESSATAGGRSYRQLDYQSAGRTVLRHVVIDGLGHAWSGGDPQQPFNDAAGPDASALIWSFVAPHRRLALP